MSTQIKPERTQSQADEERLILESVSADEVVGTEPGPAVRASVLLEELSQQESSQQLSPTHLCNSGPGDKTTAICNDE